MKHKGDVREAIGMVVCAILSLAAFLALVLLLEDGLLPAFLALVVSLACPLVWLAFLLLGHEGGGGLAHWAQRRVVSLQPALRQQDDRLTGVAAGGKTARPTARARIT
ncbi:MAG: hypothetical protein ACE5OS_10690 [Anaerolineae bacterium]